jgi:dolichyl-phosphate-mannose-protein mannosyltransferase
VVGVTTPEKFFFDKVHEVPAARQMLEPVMPAPMLNPMHLVGGNIGGRSWRQA